MRGVKLKMKLMLMLMLIEVEVWKDGLYIPIKMEVSLRLSLLPCSTILQITAFIHLSRKHQPPKDISTRISSRFPWLSKTRKLQVYVFVTRNLMVGIH